MITRCTAECPEDRYQSVGEILHDINHQRRYYRMVAVIVFVAVLLSVGLAVLTHQKPAQDSVTVVHEMTMDSVAQIPKDSVALPKENHGDRSRDSVPQNHGPVPMILQAPVSDPKPQLPGKDDQTRFTEDVERMIDQAYRSTIATFCDSVFPPPTPSTGKAWADASTEFHNQTAQIADRLAKKYPSIPETAIRQETEMRFQSLVSHVFNQMRENAKR